MDDNNMNDEKDKEEQETETSLWKLAWNQSDVLDNFQFLISQHQAKKEDVDYSVFKIQYDDTDGQPLKVPSLLSICFDQLYSKEQEIYQTENPCRKKLSYRLLSSFKLFFSIPPNDRQKFHIENPGTLVSKDSSIPYDLRQSYVLHHNCHIMPVDNNLNLVKLSLLLMGMMDNATVWSPTIFNFWTYYWIFLGSCSVDKKVAYRKLFLDFFYIFLHIDETGVENYTKLVEWFHPFTLSVEPLLKILFLFCHQFQKCTLLYFDETETFCHLTNIRTTEGKNIYPKKPEDIVWRKWDNLPWATKSVKRGLIEGKECLFKTTRYSTETLQPIWVCLTCDLGTCTNHCLCHNCALNCHKNHRLIYLGVHESWCDCYDCTC